MKLVRSLWIGLLLLGMVAVAGVADDPMPPMRIANIVYLYETVAITWEHLFLPNEKLLGPLMNEVIPGVYENLLGDGVLAYGAMISTVLNQYPDMEESGALKKWMAAANRPDWVRWPWPWPWPWPDCIPVPDWLISHWGIRNALERHHKTPADIRDMIINEPARVADLITEVLLQAATEIASPEYAPQLSTMMGVVVTDGLIYSLTERQSLLVSWNSMMPALVQWVTHSGEVTNVVTEFRDMMENAERAEAVRSKLLALPRELEKPGGSLCDFAQWEPLYHGFLIAMLLSSESLLSSP